MLRAYSPNLYSVHEKEGQLLRLMSRPMFINVGKVQYPLGIDQERYRPQVGPTETSPVLIFIGFVHKDIKNTFGNPCWKFGSTELCLLL